MAMTKADLIKILASENVLRRRDSKRAIETLLEAMKHALANGEDLLISGFGKFAVRQRGEKRVRNPRTGVEFSMGPRRVVTFKVSPVLRKKINS